MPHNDRRLYPWAVQGTLSPLTIVGAQGSWFVDEGGGRHLDLAAQLAYTNVGHGHPRVVEAIRRQAAELPVIGPGFANRPATRLAEMLAEVTPGDLNRTFFTNGGAEAIEYAIRIARQVTGRLKVVTRYQSYHGSTLGAITATGENRRVYAEPGAAGFVKTLDPYRYRCPFCRANGACTLACADAVEQTVLGEGPETVAAIVVEPVTGLSGLVPPPDGYLRRLRELCDRHGILLVFDEVITGFCRTGRWFASQVWDVTPDLMTVAKGLTSGYVPLGATIVSDRVAAHFDDHYLGAGLTYAAHPLACAAGCAVLEVYVEEDLAARAAATGERMAAGLSELADRHPCVGDVRGVGMIACLELVRSRETREPLSPQRTEGPLTAEMGAVRGAILGRRVWPLFRWNLIGLTPPLTLTPEELDHGLDALDAGLEAADRALA
ncbi:MAG TPA: aminotransferase class III-fold pyridoxal phosphate-dependent enzyme [Candidatus Dormibacteraeota bacterium]|nr:aminotransferase class III-fold pyridoxal phosphate-dependent enzyme [Candidatus Dormibacteraeota bacterium]